MAFPAHFLDGLKARVELAGVIGRKVRLTRKGREYSGLCPFHKEKTPSFTINEEKGFYHCFGCGAHGTAIDFVMNTEGLSFPEAVERLAGEIGMPVPQDSPEQRRQTEVRRTLGDVVEQAAAWFEKMLRMPEGRPGLDYLLGRGLTEKTLAHFRLGFAPNSRGMLKAALGREGFSEDLMEAAGLLIPPKDSSQRPYDRFRGRVIFPICDRQGRVAAFGGRLLGSGEPKYLNSPETELFHKGFMLYGLAQALPSARKSRELIVTEGYMDVIALAQAGFSNAVAPLGTALTEDQIRELWKVAPEPVLCFDGDSAGRRAAGRVAEKVLPLLRPGYSLRFATLPGGEDPDSLIATKGRQAMAQIVEGAIALSEALWQMESHGRVPSRPEDRAALQKRLEDHAKRIGDPMLRSHVLRAFKDRLWKAAHKAHAPAQAARLDDRAGPAAFINGLHKEQATLVALMINHPDFFQQVEEIFGSLHFDNPGLDRLRESLAGLFAGNGEGNSHYEWTPKALKAALAGQGLETDVSALFTDPLIKTNRYLREEAAAGEVRELWEETLGLLRRAAGAEEMAIGRELEDWDDGEMRRILAQRRAAHEED